MQMSRAVSVISALGRRRPEADGKLEGGLGHIAQGLVSK